MPEKQIQEYLFQQIKEGLPQGKALVDVVAETLYLSQDSAYRRLRGETPLVLEEAKILCSRFNISLDQLLQLTSASVVFQNVDVNPENYSFEHYLLGILEHLKQLNAFDEKTVIYLTTDLPFFYHLSFKAVFAFRYFFWMKSVLQHPDFQQRKFSSDCLPANIEALGKEILSLYCAVPSIEIWNTGVINSFLLQINNYKDTGLMTKQEAAELYHSLQGVVNHVELQAAYGRKFLPGENPHIKKDNFTFFYNRTALGDNSILVLHDGAKTLYLNYDVLNYMITTDESFCNQVHKKLQLIMRRSTLISNVSEKQRNIFFNILKAKFPRIN